MNKAAATAAVLLRANTVHLPVHNVEEADKEVKAVRGNE